MKTIFKLLFFLLIVGGLGAAVFLVMRNQETRRGATLTLLKPQFIPDQKSLNIGDTFTVAFGINADTNKLTAIDVKVNFDKTKLTLLGVNPVIRESNVGSSTPGTGLPLFRQNENVLSTFSMNTINQFGSLAITGISLKSSGSGENTVVSYEENAPSTLSSGYVAIARLQFRVDGGNGSHTFVTVEGTSKVMIYGEAGSQQMGLDSTQGADYTILGAESGDHYIRSSCNTTSGFYNCTATNDTGMWNGWQEWTQLRFDTNFIDQGVGTPNFVAPSLPFESGGIFPNNAAGTQYRFVGYEGNNRWARNMNYNVGTSMWDWADWEYLTGGIGITDVAFGSGAPDATTRFWGTPDRTKLITWATKGNKMWELVATAAVGQTTAYTTQGGWHAVDIFQIPGGVTGPYETITRFPANPENTIQDLVVTKNGNKYVMRYTWNGTRWIGTEFSAPADLWPVQDQPNRFDFFARIPSTMDQKTQLGVLVRGISMWQSQTNWVPTYSSLSACQDGGTTCVAASGTPTSTVAPTATPGVSACTDSDGGKTYGTKGETCQDGSCSNDSCTAAGWIREYYCDSEGNKVSEQLSCGEGKSCDAGICVTSVGETGRPAPTDTPNGSDSYLNMKVSYGGTVSNPRCSGGMVSGLIVLGDGVSALYTEVTPVRDSSITDKVVFQIHKLLTGFTKTSKVAVFLKGPKHLQMKYGVNGQSAFYNKAGGELTMTSGTDSPLYDFTGYPLLPGDINQDGVINGADFAAVKGDLHKSVNPDNNEVMATDLDGDCVVTANDAQLLKTSLNEKQSQMY